MHPALPKQNEQQKALRQKEDVATRGLAAARDKHKALENNITRKRTPWLTKTQPLTRVAVANAMAAIQLPDAQADIIDVPGPDSFMKAGGGFGGGAGMGSMNGANFKPIMMFGTQLNAKRLAVVLDVSASMTPYLENVIKEVDNVARGSPVILYYGCGLERKEPGMKLIEEVRRTQNSAFDKFWREWQQTDARLVGTSKGSMPKSQLYNFLARRNNTYFVDYNGVGFAWLAMLADEVRTADALYWFSDFEDGVQLKQMEIVLENLKLRKQKLYIHPQIKGTYLQEIVLNLVWPSGGKVIEVDQKATRAP